jgi:hypothetical protein
VNIVTSSAVNDIILRSGNRLLLQSGVNEAGLVINTNNNVAIGAVIPLTKLDVSGNLLVRCIWNLRKWNKRNIF